MVHLPKTLEDTRGKLLKYFKNYSGRTKSDLIVML